MVKLAKREGRDMRAFRCFIPCGRVAICAALPSDCMGYYHESTHLVGHLYVVKDRLYQLHNVLEDDWDGPIACVCAMAD
jgi:hypothetical protein